MKLDVYNLKNEKVGDLDVPDVIFGAEVKPHLHWEVVRYLRAKRRAGTHSTKTRHEVRGSTRKIWRQKGTGRARHGSSKAPIFVGGGRAHGPSPRSHAMRGNKKARKGALRSAISEKVADGKLKIVDDWSVETPKTQAALRALGTLGFDDALVIDIDNRGLSLSLRNAAKSKYLSVKGLNVYDVLRFPNLVITREAVTAIEGVLA